MNGFAVLANKCAEKDANVLRQLAVHSFVRMRLGRVLCLERGSSANEVIVFNTVHTPLTVSIICQFEALKKKSITKQCK